MALTRAITAAGAMEVALADTQNALANLYQPANSADTDTGSRDDRPEWWEDSTPGEQETNGLPPESAAALTDMLCELDAFLRSGGPVITSLTDFLHHRGARYPGFAARNLIDELSFTAAQHRMVTDISTSTRAPTRPDGFGDESRQQ